MMSVELQVITAVQCFLFGGLAIGASGVIADIPVRWPLAWKGVGAWVRRFVESALPGTLMGGGVVLVGAGFVSLAGATTGVLETLYILLLAVLTLATLVFMSRTLVQKEVIGASELQMSGPAQVILLLAGGVGFAHLLSLLGTTIGGESPDAVIAIAFAKNTFSFIPWMWTVVSVVFVAVLVLLKAKRADLWTRIAHPAHRMFDAIDTHCLRTSQKGRTLHAKYQTAYAALDASLLRVENRVAHMTLKESGVVVLACFVITLIVLF